MFNDPSDDPASAENTLSEPAPATEEMAAFTGDELEPPASVEILVTSPVAISESATESTAPIEPTESTEIVTPNSPATTGDGAFSLSALMKSSEADAAPPPIEAPPVLTEPATPTLDTPAISVASESVHEPVAETPTGAAPSGLSALFASAATPVSSDEVAAAEQPSVADDAPNPAAPPSEIASPSEPTECSEVAATLNSENEQLVAPTTITQPSRKDHVTVSKSALLILISYASAVTLGFLYLLYYGATNPAGHGLESLPDVVPKKTSGISIAKETASLPAGHELQVGDSRRFGNIEVSVLKVTRGPIHFQHFSDSSKSRLPTAPVLKLWLRFKNVSTNQEIAPLDDQLLFRRFGKNRFEYRSNQFVRLASQQKDPDAKRIIAFDHIIGSGWDLADLPLDKPLKPGESHDYYVPTCENDLDILTGELVWRVHIRKGYSSRGNGVTTLFEVRFNSDAISDEAA